MKKEEGQSGRVFLHHVCFLTSLTASQSLASKPRLAVELFFAEERARAIGVGMDGQL